MYRVFTGQENSHGTPELWAIAHENVHKTRKRRVLVMYRVFWALRIALEPQNVGQKLMITAIKCENDEFLVIILKHVSGLMGPANRPRTPKPWAIAYENVHKTRKRQVFWSYLSNMYWVLRAMQIAVEPEKYGQQLMKTAIKRENYGFLVLTHTLVSGLSSHANRPKTPKTVGSSSWKRP